MVIAVGEQAPEFSLEAAVSGKKIGPTNGRKTVLVLHGNKTQDAPKLVGKAVRGAHPEWESVLVANIVNLKPFAGLFAKVATAQIKQTYEKMAGKLASHAEELVVICPDFENAIAPLFGVADSDKVPAVVVLDAGGKVLASHEGKEGLEDAALAAL